MNRTPDKRGTGAGKAGKKTTAKKAAKKSASDPAKGGDLPPWFPEQDVTARSPKAKPAKTATPSKAARQASGKPARKSSGRGKGPSDPHAAREAARYENPIASRELILETVTESDGPMDTADLAAKLGLEEGERFNALTARIRAMVRDGQLHQNRRGGLVPARRVDLIPGSVIANPDGFGFMRPDEGTGDDLFLPPSEMRKVMHGDRVLAHVTGVDRRGRREGAIVEVLERRLSRMIGRFVLEDGVSYVEPDDARIQRNILIPPEFRGEARDGQLVVCEITRAPEPRRAPLGKILTVLGDRLTASLAVQAAIHGHDIPHEFPQQVLDQAAALPHRVEEAEIAGRVDIRDLPLVTIDGEDAKDFDDAVYCETNRDGFRLVVAIADVSQYVRPGEPLDEEAQKRATSVYFPGFVVPMLPETLSNGICSLKPKVDRMCFVCDMQVDRQGRVTGSKFYEAVMHSHARLTYTQVWNAVGDDVTDERRDEALEMLGPVLPQVERLHQLYQVLRKAREKRGAIEFESSEVRFVLGNKGEVTQAGMIIRNDAHKLIEECMIAANVEAAKYLIDKEVPAPFRIHDRPPEQKYTDLLEFLKEFKLRMPPWAKVQPRDYTRLLREVRERGDATLIESVLLRSQSLAVYQPENLGHFGLALEAYAHFTSPIRRYADLLVHRAIKHALSGKRREKFRYSPSDMAQLALQCSERARRAEDAEREVDDRYRAAWMEQHVGGEFDGVISGVTSFGLFIELSESKVNGLVHVTQLPHDFYSFDPIRKTLTGERHGREYRLGDPARIIVLKASVEDRKIDFRLVREDGEAKEPKAPTERGKPAKRKKQKY